MLAPSQGPPILCSAPPSPPEPRFTRLSPTPPPQFWDPRCHMHWGLETLLPHLEHQCAIGEDSGSDLGMGRAEVGRRQGRGKERRERGNPTLFPLSPGHPLPAGLALPSPSPTCRRPHWRPTSSRWRLQAPGEEEHRRRSRCGGG